MCCSDPSLTLLMLSLKYICILHTRKEDMILMFIKKILFLFLTVLGILGNMSVSVNYMFSWRGSPEKKPIHLILIHLAFTNILFLLVKGLPKTIVSFGLKNFLDDTGCKIIVYLERVARGLSICTSSLLTVVQAIIISPRASEWKKLIPKSAWHILPLFLFFWVINALISVNLINSITKTSPNSSQHKSDNNNCYFMLPTQKIKWIVLPLMVLRDAVFQVAMGGASGYMVFLLHKHHQHVLYLQNSKLLHRTSPELRAAQSVLLLMLCFAFFYWTDCAFSLILSISSRDNALMRNP
ncbi:vomeronasal type-1 receptor 4-like [Arvicanthis niloticus]|uniref:vomeronasal type-1 receptor 4-like n=1 Tax=Arvicanthis niloticus TaxID=61156 RepID=UPI001487057B|nr:vomeronasal type-1 receptor 4-like [Arvicanthis niloticus]